MRRSMEKLRALMIQGDRENRRTMLNTALNSKNLDRPKLKPCIKTITSELKPTRSVSFRDTPKMRPFLSTFSSMIGLAIEPHIEPMPLAEIRMYERLEDKIIDDVTPLWEQRAVNGGQVLEDEEIDCTYLMYGRLVTGNGSEGFPTQNGDLEDDIETDDDEYSSGSDEDGEEEDDEEDDEGDEEGDEEEGDEEECASQAHRPNALDFYAANSSHSSSYTFERPSIGPLNDEGGASKNASSAEAGPSAPVPAVEDWLSDVIYHVSAQRRKRKRPAASHDDEDARDEHFPGASADVHGGLGTLKVAPGGVSLSQGNDVSETMVQLNDKGHPSRETVDACEEYVTSGQCGFETGVYHNSNSVPSDEASVREGRGGAPCSVVNDGSCQNTDKVLMTSENADKRRESNDSSSTRDYERGVDEADNKGDAKPDTEADGCCTHHSDDSRGSSITSCCEPKRKMLRTH